MGPIKRITPMTHMVKSGKVLNEKEELFAKAYVNELGNGAEAFSVSYNVDKSKPTWRTTCSSGACELLKRPHILERIRELLDLGPLHEAKVDNELNFLITQSGDLSSKRGGIDIFNRLKGRYEKDNMQKKPEVVINIDRVREIDKALDDI